MLNVQNRNNATIHVHTEEVCVMPKAWSNNEISLPLCTFG